VPRAALWLCGGLAAGLAHLALSQAGQAVHPAGLDQDVPTRLGRQLLSARGTILNFYSFSNSRIHLNPVQTSKIHIFLNFDPKIMKLVLLFF
jgi:hypothetical protein